MRAGEGEGTRTCVVRTVAASRADLALLALAALDLCTLALAHAHRGEGWRMPELAFSLHVARVQASRAFAGSLPLGPRSHSSLGNSVTRCFGEMGEGEMIAVCTCALCAGADGVGAELGAVE